MMPWKTVCLVFVSFALFGFSAHAAKDAGCGFGAGLFEGKEDKASNIMAATTNGSSGNQTFGMTFGTLGCGSNEMAKKLDIYLEDNMEELAFDASRGEGETLEGLLFVMDIPAKERASFKTACKENFSSVFSHSKTRKGEVKEALLKLKEESLGGKEQQLAHS